MCCCPSTCSAGAFIVLKTTPAVNKQHQKYDRQTTQGSSNTTDSCHEQNVRSDEYALVSANAPLLQYSMQMCQAVSWTQHKSTDAVTPLLFTNKHMRTDVLVAKACVQKGLT